MVVKLDCCPIDRELLVLRVEEEFDGCLIERECEHFEERNEKVNRLLILVELQVHTDQLVDKRVRKNVV